ncbi:manganese efflux pump MntP family protein [Spirochaeta thermophila]|uniref:manganese efflux pump MntP n=1 Tax=Winmispira thermophila TaxID=154 RepID=UPI0002EC22CD|nr:manganese efflux pump MntP family protein [Spirochaeta thermophila]
MPLFMVTGLAVSLAIDACAAAASLACSHPGLKRRILLLIALSFGAFQAGMTFLGIFTASSFIHLIQQWDHWIAFLLLAVTGSKMIREGLLYREEGACRDADPPSLWKVLSLSVATSLDALAVGLTLGFLSRAFLLPVLLIGLVTLGLSFLSGLAGKYLATFIERYAEMAGGLVLWAVGIRTLLTHLL